MRTTNARRIKLKSADVAKGSKINIKTGSRMQTHRREQFRIEARLAARTGDEDSVGFVAEFDEAADAAEARGGGGGG